MDPELQAAEQYRAGASLRAAARTLGCDHKTARKRLAAAGVAIRSPHETLPAGWEPPHPIRSMVSPGVWLERYIVRGESLASLARWAGEVTGRSCGTEVIRKALRDCGISVRSSGQQVRIEFRLGIRTATRGHAGRRHSAESRRRISEGVRRARSTARRSTSRSSRR